MPHDSPRQAEDGPGRPREEPSGNGLDALEERLRSAQETAERLVREATETARRAATEEQSAGHRPPPRGYAVPGDGGGATGPDLQALLALLELARTIVPPELRRQLTELLREILLLVRAIVDWYLERIDRRRGRSVEVEDIPIS